MTYKNETSNDAPKRHAPKHSPHNLRSANRWYDRCMMGRHALSSRVPRAFTLFGSLFGDAFAFRVHFVHNAPLSVIGYAHMLRRSLVEKWARMLLNNVLP